MKRSWKKLSRREIGWRFKLHSCKIKLNWTLERKLSQNNLLRKNKKIHKNQSLK